VQENSQFLARFNKWEDFYLYGATPAVVGTLELLEKMNKTVIGFIDKSPAKQQNGFMGKPVLSPAAFFEQDTKSAGIIIVAAYQLEIYHELIKKHVAYERIFPLLDGMFFPTYGGTYYNDSTLMRLRETLDAGSGEKEFFTSWLNFKETGNLSDIRPLSEMTAQYAHPSWLSEIIPGGVCLDIGAYDGLSSFEFAKMGLFSAIEAFEPFEANFGKLQKMIATTDVGIPIHAHRLALGKKRQTIWQLQEDVSSRSRLQDDQQNRLGDKDQIEIVALDDLDFSDITMIKVDIEGSEMDFLHGAVKTIKLHRPCIAISAYHNREHCSKILRFFEENFEGFTFRVGHHPLAVYELEYYISFAGKGS